MIAYTFKISPAKLTLLESILRRFSLIVFKYSMENLELLVRVGDTRLR
jgi:hypothetical protein